MENLHDRAPPLPWPVYFTASPINNGNTMKNLGGNNRLNDYAIARL